MRVSDYGWWPTNSNTHIIKRDNTSPAWWVFSINDTALASTSTSVILNIDCPVDAWVGGVQVAFWNTPNPTNRQSCSSSISHTLTAWDGTKTVYMAFRDSLSNTTSDITDTITLDSIPPVIVFTWATPEHNIWTTNTTFTAQFAIIESNIWDFDWSRNGMNYNLYDSGLVLMYNFDNISSLGENASTVKDVSQYANDGTINWATWTWNGRWSGAIDFNGVWWWSVWPVININDSDSLDVGYNKSMTVAFWIKNDNNVCAAIVKKAGMREIYRCGSDSITARFDGVADQTSPTSLNNW
jgi:hypothetical protein